MKSSPLSPVTRMVCAPSPVTLKFHSPGAGSFTLIMSAFLILRSSFSPFVFVKATPVKDNWRRCHLQAEIRAGLISKTFPVEKSFLYSVQR